MPASVYTICARVCGGHKLGWGRGAVVLSFPLLLQLLEPPDLFLKPQKELFGPEHRNSSNFFRKEEK